MAAVCHGLQAANDYYSQFEKQAGRVALEVDVLCENLELFVMFCLPQGFMVTVPQKNKLRKHMCNHGLTQVTGDGGLSPVLYYLTSHSAKTT